MAAEDASVGGQMSERDAADWPPSCIPMRRPTGGFTHAVRMERVGQLETLCGRIARRWEVVTDDAPVCRACARRFPREAPSQRAEAHRRADVRTMRRRSQTLDEADGPALRQERPRPEDDD
jgi:hypothetical protein